MTDEANTKSAARCGFGELAKRINEAHRLARDHAQSAIEHALRAGALLLEAKAGLPHGRWLPWLRENVSLSERTVQGYLRLASRQDAIRAKLAADPGLSVRQALGHLSVPLGLDVAARPPQDDLLAAFDGDLLALGKHLLDRPFCEYDVTGEGWLPAFETKIQHRVGLPAVAGFALAVQGDYPDVPMLRLVPDHELLDAAKQLAPLATGVEPIAIEAGAEAAMRIAGLVKLVASRLLGAVLAEVERREVLADEELDRDATAALDQFMATARVRVAAA